MSVEEMGAISVDVGVRLRELRQERDMSMRALARESGLSANALSMIERGRTSPSVSTLYKLADAMRIPITAFFREEPPRQDLRLHQPCRRRSGLNDRNGGDAAQAQEPAHGADLCRRSRIGLYRIAERGRRVLLHE